MNWIKDHIPQLISDRFMNPKIRKEDRAIPKMMLVVVWGITGFVLRGLLVIWWRVMMRKREPLEEIPLGMWST